VSVLECLQVVGGRCWIFNVYRIAIMRCGEDLLCEHLCCRFVLQSAIGNSAVVINYLNGRSCIRL
jgi:hypothetical protein